MIPLHLTITSTAFNAAPFVERCLRSVREQTHENWTHHYIVNQGSTDGTFELARQWSGVHRTNHPTEQARTRVTWGAAPAHPVDSSLENLLPIWRKLPPEEVIVWLDGDDALLIPKALEIVAQAHEAGAWATWGQFVTTEGVSGFAGPVGPCPRREAWRATHLKTFRAGLVQRLRPEELTLVYARDQAVMMGVLEQAAERGRYLDRLLYLYEIGNSFLRNAPPEKQRAEAEVVAKIRAFPRYSRLEKL